MGLDVHKRSFIIIILGALTLLFNYCWQYRICCDVLTNLAKFKQANEGFRPPIYFTMTKQKIQDSNFGVFLPKQVGIKHEGREGEQLKPEKGTNLLIVSQGRSGSSFVGQIFNQDRRTFYLYEPLLSIERVETIDTFVGNKTEQFQEIATRYLQQVLNCNLTKSPYLEYLSRPSHFRLSSRVLSSPPFCSENVEHLSAREISNNNTCSNLDSDVLNSVCKNYTVKVMKILEHRLPGRTIASLKRFFSDGKSNLKLLYLVRDPRAFVLSMFQSGWIARLSGNKLITYDIGSERFEWYIKRICAQMDENIAFVKNPPSNLRDRVLLLRYEDLISNAEGTAERLFNFVGLEKSSNLSTWLYQRMHTRGKYSKRSVEEMYSTARNSTYSMVRWRLEASFEMVKIVEKHCKNVMNDVGYITTNGSVSLQYDLTKPLVRAI